MLKVKIFSHIVSEIEYGQKTHIFIGAVYRKIFIWHKNGKMYVMKKGRHKNDLMELYIIFRIFDCILLIKVLT